MQQHAHVCGRFRVRAGALGPPLAARQFVPGALLAHTALVRGRREFARAAPLAGFPGMSMTPAAGSRAAWAPCRVAGRSGRRRTRALPGRPFASAARSHPRPAPLLARCPWRERSWARGCGSRARPCARTVELQERPEAGDVGCVWSLQGDEDLVAEGVARQAVGGADLDPALPYLRFAYYAQMLTSHRRVSRPSR
jgi:hypothetical protein